jgi:Rho-binding antiterminator
MSDYTPIDCGLYSEYELAILRRKRLRLSWRTAEGQLHVAVIMPKDLKTGDHAEFLVGEDADHRGLVIRLDHIIKAETL